jgi:hypothetical protein
VSDLASILVLGFGPHRNPWPYFCLSRHLCILKWCHLFQEIRDLTATSHSLSSGKWLSSLSLSPDHSLTALTRSLACQVVLVTKPIHRQYRKCFLLLLCCYVLTLNSSIVACWFFSAEVFCLPLPSNSGIFCLSCHNVWVISFAFIIIYIALNK